MTRTYCKQGQYGNFDGGNDGSGCDDNNFDGGNHSSGYDDSNSDSDCAGSSGTGRQWVQEKKLFLTLGSRHQK